MKAILSCLILCCLSPRVVEVHLPIVQIGTGITKHSKTLLTKQIRRTVHGSRSDGKGIGLINKLQLNPFEISSCLLAAVDFNKLLPDPASRTTCHLKIQSCQ